MADTKLPTGIRLTDMSTKWGMVLVVGKDGSVARQYAITASEANAVAAGNNVLPPGCTEDEWFSGRVVVLGRSCNPGQAVINPDGTMVVNYGVTETANKIDVKLMQLYPSEYEQVGNVLYVDVALAAQIDQPFVEVKPEPAKVP